MEVRSGSAGREEMGQVSGCLQGTQRQFVGEFTLLLILPFFFSIKLGVQELMLWRSQCSDTSCLRGFG